MGVKLIPPSGSSISGRVEADRRIWYTYLSNALEATRDATKLDSHLKVRPEYQDSDLICVKQSKGKAFTKSLNAIVLNIFVIEYRINRAAQYLNIWNSQVSSYVDENEGVVSKTKEFKYLTLYQKWRNILRVSGKKETKKYTESVKRLRKWIFIRNDITHADYNKIRALNITPSKARRCYNDSIKAMFELNVAINYNSRRNADEDYKKMRL